MRRLVISMALLAVTSCGGSADPATLQPAGCEDTASCPFDPDSPVLQLSAVCYGECVFVAPLALPEVVLYGDGRVVRTSRSLPDPRPVVTTGQATADQVDALVRLARDAGLTGGGRSVLDPEAAANLADGGAAVLTGRFDRAPTTIESALLLGPPDLSRAEPDQRQRLRALGEALRALTATSAYDDDRVVLHARPSPDDDAPADVWTGPRLSALPDSTDGSCAIVDGEPARATLAAVAEDAFATVYEEDGVLLQVEARPVLPHETSCAEVAETVRLGGSERAATF